MHQIPFNQETYRPRSIPGNTESATPVEFDLSQVGGSDLVRLKTMIFAFSGVAMVTDWTPDLQRSVVDAFVVGPTVFASGIDAIRNFTIPAALAVKAGVLEELGDRDPKSAVAVKNGRDFAKIVGFQTILGLEIAMQIARISDEGDIDPRFFASPTTSPATVSIATDTDRSGSATDARRRRGRRGTADKRTPPGGR